MTDLPNTPLSILTLENEALILLDIEGILLEAGYQVSIASTAEQALALLDAVAFHGAVIDIGLHDGDSFAVADALTLRKVPFVFCTGSNAIEIREPYLAVPVISKPFTEQLLLDAIGQVLQPR